MTNPEIRDAFEAYRAAVQAEKVLADGLDAEHRAPTLAERAEFDRLETEITAHKAAIEARTADTPDTSDAAATVVRIHKLGKTPTAAQSRDLEAAADELLTASAGLDHHGIANARDQLAEAIKHRNTAAAALWAPEVARLITVQHRAREVDAARASFGPLFTQSDRNERMKTSEPTIAELWDVVRTNGYTAAEFHLSADYMESRALGSTGGSAIPTGFADFVVEYERTASPQLDPNVVRIINTPSGAPLVIPRLTSDISSGSVTAEAATISESDPAISSISLGAYGYKSINTFSAELDQDNAIAIRELLADSTGRELGLTAGSALTVGDGSGKPYGFLAEATNGGTALGTAQTGGAPYFGWPDLITLWGSVAAPYRTRGAFQVSPSAFTKILGFRDDNGNPILGLSAGGQPTILGRPVYENPSMAAAGSATKSVAFGAFDRYIVKRVSPIRVEVSRDAAFESDQVKLKVVDRLDGRLVDTAAVAFLVSANT